MKETFIIIIIFLSILADKDGIAVGGVASFGKLDDETLRNL